jgi:predicted nucleic acid-binding protein
VRAPSTAIVVDAAILVAAVRGRSSGALLLAARAASLFTTDRVAHEARRCIALGLKRPELVALLDLLLAEMTVVPVAALTPYLDDGETVLNDAVGSSNGATRHAHVLALAWSVEGDVWTTDRDFAGTGVASWSTPNLMRAISAASGGRR